MAVKSSQRKGSFEITEEEMQRVRQMKMSSKSLNRLNKRDNEIKEKEA